ncbi:MAG TPA: transcription termination factor Rho [Acidimicrobiales bacterium]|nr:transcription termination factor Rho [Acidimicrobiales bacterium]
MSAETLERSVLEGKDREQLIAIASALGLKALSRAKKGEIIDRILDQTGAGAPDLGSRNGNGDGGGAGEARPAGRKEPDLLDEHGEPLADWEIELRRNDTVGPPDALPESGDRPAGVDGSVAPSSISASTGATTTLDPDVDADADVEADVETGADADAQPREDTDRGYRGGEDGQDGQGGGRRRRRRRRKGGALDEGPQGTDRPGDGREPRDFRDARSGVAPEDVGEPVQVGGYLDLRDEGYGFLRVNGYLPSRDDVYVSVKQTRQYGLRKGDQVTGLSRVAARNEKNPALLQILTVNDGDPELARLRPRFEDLTPLFPDEKLRLESPADPSNMTSRIIDLIAPIGKGQRGLIVSPPKAGKTFIMKTIATSIERNNPEVTLIVLLIDERPEEVTDMRRTVQGEVIASTFDRPSDEHTQLAELAIEKAKRLVEAGEDVVVILDGITRLSRAYNLAAPATGRIMSGGIDAGALYPPKKFFGAARNIEEGGSLTILATALVETNSRMDDAIFEEFKGTGNMELRLDRKLAERRIFPAIDVDASSTRHEELLFDRKGLQQVWKLRRVLSGLAADGNAAPGLELLMDRLKTFRSNDEFLAEIAKQPSM